MNYILNMTIDEIRLEAKSLDDSEKGQLAKELLDMIPPSEYWVTDDEVHERVRQLEDGELQDISFEELKSRLGR